MPGLWQLRHYQRSWLRGDVLAGVTVAAYLVPQVMAYAEVAGLPAIAGLWAIVGPLAVYAVLGILAATFRRTRVEYSPDDRGRSSCAGGGRDRKPC